MLFRRPFARLERPAYDIGFYIPSVAPLIEQAAQGAAGGAETQLLLLSRALVDRGVRVSLCAFESPDATQLVPHGGINVVRRPRPSRRGRGRVGSRICELKAIRNSVHDL